MSPLTGAAADWRKPMAPGEHFDETGHWRVARAGPVAEWGQALFGAVHACLARLPPNVARAYTLRECQGLALEDIAATLSITTGDCAVLLHRARVSIHAMLNSANL